jgi:flagellar biosynthesis component FlhA
VLCVAESLRQSAASLLPRRTVRARVQQLAPLYPALVKRARATVSDEQVTRIVRALVAERVPVHDLRTVLERLCDSEFGTADAGRGLILGDRTYDVYGVGEEPPEDAVSFVRSGLTRQIAGAAARGTRTLVVYLLDPALERPFESVGDDEPPSDGMADTLLAALTRELAYLPPTALVPCLLTAGRARAGVRAAIKHRYPRVSVVAHEELPADLNVQPVARISAS